MRVEQCSQKLGGEAGHVPVQDEHVAVEAVEGSVRGAHRVARAERPFLHCDLDTGKAVARVGRRDDDERVDAGAVRGGDHPVDEPPSEQRMQVLGNGRVHPRSEAGGHHDCCWLRGRQGMNGWGARIRTWDRGTKTRCLTTWLRPTAFEYRNRWTGWLAPIQTAAPPPPSSIGTGGTTLNTLGSAATASSRGTAPTSLGCAHRRVDHSVRSWCSRSVKR
jgi:hypothetical protein